MEREKKGYKVKYQVQDCNTNIYGSTNNLKGVSKIIERELKKKREPYLNHTFIFYVKEFIPPFYLLYDYSWVDGDIEEL